MKWQVILIAVLAIFGVYLVISTAVGPFEPVGRLAFVKLANPDMYPGHPHSKLLAQYAEERGSKCALVVHFAGDSNYRHYKEGDVMIIELALIDTEGTGAADPTDYLDSLKLFLYGPDEGRYKFRADGIEFNSWSEAREYVLELAAENGQQGPMPMVWHGTARSGNPIFIQGCGFPLYFYITWQEYGRFAAYYYIVKGMMTPYISLPYRNYELLHSSELQYYYTNNMLNYQ
ncbi:hypothetical protein [Methanobacterium petrolearium]|uniref:hypothetical protein n=1 Tax=Methanobacterium petrolearium TaxID=710190 RepID=UPI001AE9CC38|nr:hypothetical protein [Methanobacterium petrolearium]MBP1947068.1 hypothetical protein [Methanobacterium petrolearium]BDZ69709.1 hypothetical protein GCM10025861_02260 [Methanobacterium petrolearium]